MLEWTGERFLPWVKEPTIAYEHLHRYAYAAALVEGKSVLDLACGEGYGSKILSGRAASVVGVDIDENAVRHATNKYAGRNVQFISGSIMAIPIPDDHRFDAIVCFEAIEHIQDQGKLLGEVKRLLNPHGIFIVSTPNKAVYRDEAGQHNPFHEKELYFEEFRQLLARYFTSATFLGQRVYPGSSIWPIAASDASLYREFVIERGDSEYAFVGPDKRIPMYFIAVASDGADVPPQSGSVLLDHSDGRIEEKNQAILWLEQQVAERGRSIASLEKALTWREGQVRELSDQIASLGEGATWQQSQVRDLTDQISSLNEAVTWREGQVKELSEAIASLEEGVIWHQRQISALEESLKSHQAQLEALSRDLEWSRRHSSELEKTIAIRDETTALSERQWAELETANALLSADLELTRAQLAAVYASRGWRLISRLRKLRNSIIGPGRPRA